MASMFLFTRSFTNINKKFGINEYLRNYTWCDRCCSGNRSYHAAFQQKVPKSLSTLSSIKFQYQPNTLVWKRVSILFYLITHVEYYQHRYTIANQ